MYNNEIFAFREKQSEQEGIIWEVKIANEFLKLKKELTIDLIDSLGKKVQEKQFYFEVNNQIDFK